MQIGFIGLGIMGSRMAVHLQKAGHKLIVHNRTKEKAKDLKDNLSFSSVVMQKTLKP